VLITGRLEAPAGTPSGVVAGASVEVLPARLDYEGARRQLAGQVPGPPLAATRAAAGGAFRLQVPGPGCFRVVVRAAGFLPLEVPLVPLVEDRELPPARLTPAVPLVARTVGPRGEPIAGVVLSLQSQEREQAPGRSREQGWAPVRRTGRTGPDGTLALPGSPGEKAWLAAIDPRFLGAWLAVDEPPAKAGASGKTGAGGITLRLPHRPALTLEACTPGGEPVAGALLRSSSGWPLAIAGGDGRLEVAVAGHAAGHPTPLGFTLESPDGEMTAEVSWAQARGGVLRVALAPRREAAGQLVEASGGQAVAGGVVWAECRDRFSGRPMGVATVSASGPDGRFRLGLPAGKGLRLRAAAPGCVTARLDEPGRAALLTIPLERVVALAGQVVDAAGEAVGGARIEAREAGLFGIAELLASAATGPTGRFQLAALAAGKSYELEVSAAGFAPASALMRAPAAATGAGASGGVAGQAAAAGARGSRSIARQAAAAAGPTAVVPDAPAAQLRIVLEAGLSVGGTIVDGGGQPLGGIAILLVRVDELVGRVPARWLLSRGPGEGSWQAASDDQGAFELRHLNPGRYGLIASGAGFVATDRPLFDLMPDSPRLDLGRIVLEPGVAIEGVVTDRRGQPVADAWVWFAPVLTGRSSLGFGDLNPAAGRAMGVVAAGSDGRFRLADLRRGELFDVDVHHGDHPTASVRGVRAPSAEPLAIALADGARLSGRVVNAGGEAVFGAKVAVRVPRGEAGAFSPGTGPGETESDARGEFSLAGLAAGALDLEVSAEGYQPTWLDGLQVAAERDSPPLEVVLERGGSLAGRVHDAAGEPIPGARVCVFPAIADFDTVRRRRISFHKAMVAADGEGHYQLAGLEPGLYDVTAGIDRAQTRRAEIRPGPNRLDLVAATPEEPRRSTVSGRVLDGSGRPLAGAVVGLANAEGQLVLPRRSSLSDGSFVFGGVEPGRYHLAASARGYVGSAYPGGFEVAAAPLERLELVLQRAAGAIRGRLGGDAADPAQVRVGALWLGAGGPHCRQQPQAPDEIPGLLDGSGSYRISDLGPGTWDVFAVAASGRNASGRVDLAPGVSEAVLDLDLSSGFTLSGRVGDDRGPVAGARLGLLGPSLAAGKREVEAASDGSFQFSNLTPGSYGLIVLDPRFFRGAVLSFDLSSDREMAVDLTGGGLRGRVTSAATGEPVAGVEVTLHPMETSMHSFPPAQATTDRGGGFEIAWLLPGRYRAVASAPEPGLAEAEAMVQVAPHTTAAVELALGPPGARTRP
jgi:protocatechuate 3,4-dioxygenase beta subunit